MYVNPGLYICSPLAQLGKARIATFTSLHLVKTSTISFSCVSTSVLKVAIWFQSLAQYTPLISILKYDCVSDWPHTQIYQEDRQLVYISMELAFDKGDHLYEIRSKHCHQLIR